jgi:deoxyribonuclease-4
MHDKKYTLLLGAHMSIAGGLEQAVIQGESIGCSAIQLFTKSNRQWKAKKLSQEDIDLFKQTVQKSSIKKEHIVAHATYLINLGSTDAEINKKSIAALIEEVERCNALQIPYLVLHPGSSKTTNITQILDTIIQNLDTVFQQAPGNTMILLETMAGQGTSVCYQLEQLAYIYKKSAFKHRIGICLDTCHIFAAGYDFRTQETYDAFWIAFDQIIGIDVLKIMHVNDSKKELGSRVDRHDNIGDGKIGLTGFELLFNDKRFFTIPKILETPKNSLEEDIRNMNVIRKLLSQETRKLYGLVDEKT